LYLTVDARIYMDCAYDNASEVQQI